MTRHTTSSAVSSKRQLHLQLHELVSQTAIGEVLESVDETNCEEFYQYYLHDFVKSVHRCHHKQQKSENLEYKVFSYVEVVRITYCATCWYMYVVIWQCTGKALLR